MDSFREASSLSIRIEREAELLDRLKQKLRYPYARLHFGLKSEMARLKARRAPTVVHHEAPYQGERIMLLALYEKGELRPDILRLIRAAKDAGLYVVAVNTLKLRQPEALHDHVDCYIERPNFGRDFGSYKTGFMHVYERGWNATCERLLMLNDSIYYNEERLPGFIAEMMDSDIEALGSTENFEIEHHLGSFCIAVGGLVLRHPLFEKYWRQYRLSDIRPTVIKRGEMGLTRTLKRCVSAPHQFSALYGAARFAEEVSRDPGLLDFAVKNSRRSDRIHWERATAVNLVEHLMQRFTVPTHDMANKDITVEFSNSVGDSREWVTTLSDIEQFVRRKLSDPEEFDPAAVRKAIAGLMSEIFMVGSQIHQSAVVLLHMGLPIVKLDLLYRGVFNLEDVNLACEQIGARDARELRPLLIERP